MAREVDHIVELADGGSFSDWVNLRSTCKECHKKKTAKSRMARAAAKKIPTISPNPVFTNMRCLMAAKTIQVTFNSLKVGAYFTIKGERFKKFSALTYESLDNAILGETYSTPGLLVDVVAPVNPTKAVVSKAVKKTVKKTAKR